MVVRYYALLREISGRSSEELEVDSCYKTIGEVLEAVVQRHPELSKMVYNGLVIVIHGGDMIRDLNRSIDLCSDPTVDLVPPSAGGDEKPYKVLIVLDRTIDAGTFLRELLSKLDPESGAIALYFGVVKGRIRSSRVDELKYEYHAEHTEKVLERIAMEASKIEDVRYVLVHHSIGTFKPGDVVFAVGVISRGRRGAIGALQEVVERVKHEAAIWKIERRDDGVFWVIGEGERIPAKTKES